MPSTEALSKRPATKRVAAPQRERDWAVSALLLVAVGVSIAGLNSLLAGLGWWFSTMIVVLLVLVTAAVTRMLVRSAVWPIVCAAVVGFVTVTVMFASEQSAFGVIPTAETFQRFAGLLTAGTESIATQGIPADADEGIVFFLCAGIGLITLAIDMLAFAVRSAPATGLPLLVLLMIPSFVRPSLDDGFIFVLTAMAWVAIMLVRSRRPGRRAALAVASVALVAGLAVPLALPPLESTASNQLSGSALTTGLNPILNLGNDLRRGGTALAFTYRSSTDTGAYTRLTALDDFSGDSWSPSVDNLDPANRVDSIPRPADIGPDVPVTETTTDFTVGNILTQWLPAPYAPESVDGLAGRWAWEPDALTIRSEGSSARGQDYTVDSIEIAPSIDQLEAAGTTVGPGMERYLALPADLPPVVGQTAADVTAGAASNYARAVALQDYFQSDQFTYSEDAPVEDGYDGSGASVLGEFLQTKAGYCVHYASAMASMARTLGIPARIAVGFTPGERVVLDDETSEYRVNTDNFHSWPELNFDGIGWVRFEPTPGRGAEPRFAQLAEDDPATPDVDESVATPVPEPTTEPSAAVTPQPRDDPAATDPQAIAPGASGRGIPWGTFVFLALLALVSAPGLVRSARRAGRLRSVDDGSAVAAWNEIRDTADDLGFTVDDGWTPRQFAEHLTPHLSVDARRSLDDVRIQLEAEAFGAAAASPRSHDVRVIIRALRRGRGLGTTIVSMLLPRSLVNRWRPVAART